MGRRSSCSGSSLLLGAFLLWLNTDPGRRFIVRQINAFETASGLQVHVGRIEGSVFGELTLHDLTLADPQGHLLPRADGRARLPAVRLSVRNHIDIRVARHPRGAAEPPARAARPAIPTRRCCPTSTSTSAGLRIGRLLIDPAVTGRRHLLVARQPDQDRRRPRPGRRSTPARSRAPGLAGGDRLRAAARRGAGGEPARHRRSACAAPGDGFVAGLAGIDQPVAAHVARPRQLGELAGPRPGDARRPGLRRPRRHRPRRHLHRHRAARARA